MNHAEPHPQSSVLSTPQPSASSQAELARDERGTTTVEYVILLVLVAVIGITAWSHIGTALLEKVELATEAIRNLGR